MDETAIVRTLRSMVPPGAEFDGAGVPGGLCYASGALLTQAAGEIETLREIVRRVDEHLFHEMQHVPLTPELADAYDRAIVHRAHNGRSGGAT